VRFNPDVFYNDFKDAQLVLLSCPQYGGPATDTCWRRADAQRISTAQPT
jgi:hypothetical protein